MAGCQGSMLCWLLRLLREVPFAGSYGQLAALWPLRLHAHGPVSTEGGCFCGVIADGVLVPDITCNLGRDLVHILQRTREVSHAARLERERLQIAPGARGLLLAEVLIEEPNGVYDRAIQGLDTPDRLSEGQPGRIVSAICDDEQHLLLLLCMSR